MSSRRNVAEVEEYVPEFATRYGIDEESMLQVLEILPIVRYSERDYITHIAAASKYLCDRDPDDVALAALALKLNVPIWSNDNDLNEIPLQIFTTARLLKLLGI